MSAQLPTIRLSRDGATIEALRVEGGWQVLRDGVLELVLDQELEDWLDRLSWDGTRLEADLVYAIEAHHRIGSQT